MGVAPKALGAVTDATGLPATCIMPLPMLISGTGAAPPCVARNCQGGLTWKGRSAR